MNSSNPSNNGELIVKLTDTFQHGDNFCMVFERLGLSLYELMKKNEHIGYPLSLVSAFFK